MTPPEALRQRAIRPLRNLCDQGGKPVDELVAAYEAKVGDNELELRVALETDRVFRIPAIRLAEAQVAQGSPVWMYRFDWKTPAFGGAMGACHALEIPFVFDNLDAPGVDVFTGGAAPQTLATTAHDAWVSFAKTGSPGWDAYDTYAAGDDAAGRRESRVVDDPERRKIFVGFFARLKEDLDAARSHDPAARGSFENFFAYSGLHAIWAHRLTHKLWQNPALRFPGPADFPVGEVPDGHRDPSRRHHRPAVLHRPRHGRGDR